MTDNHLTSFRLLGASNHVDHERGDNDFYATDPKAIDLLLTKEIPHKNVWECAAGQCHLADALTDKGFVVKKSDIVQRRYDVEILDFLECTEKAYNCDILTNPPFKTAEAFVRQALSLVDDGYNVYMFLKLTFLEGASRKNLFIEFPPKSVYVFSKRIGVAKNGDFSTCKSPVQAYAWFVWQKGYKGDTILDWI